jgi:orotidine-5'-phosphate decarboxylase
MFNVHASSGVEAMRACVENKGSALAIAVTVLTSLNEIDVQQLFGDAPARKVLQLARLACAAGMDGVVCSPQEVGVLKQNVETRSLVTVVPGIRPSWAAGGDQSRIATPGAAVRAGADYLVIGRPIVKPPATIGSRQAAVEMIRQEIEQAEEEVRP